MINNRQVGRRRGRGGQRPQGSGGRPESGNRIDSRARGNASQLLEKYRNMARDAQMSGDRVATEYYLQFADHYFRVLNENRPRNEEPQGQQHDDEDEDEDRFDDRRPSGGDRRPPESDRRHVETERRMRDQDRQSDGYDQPRERRPDPRDGDADRNGAPRDGAAPGASEAGVERPRRGRRPRIEADRQDSLGDASDASIADRLPPSIAPVSSDDAREDAPAPRRRGRRPRDGSGDDGATAAA